MATASEIIVDGRAIVARLIRQLEHDDTNHNPATCEGCNALHAGRDWIAKSRTVRVRTVNEPPASPDTLPLPAPYPKGQF